MKYCSASSWSFRSFSWLLASCFSLEHNQQSVNRCCWPTTYRAKALSPDQVWWMSCSAIVCQQYYIKLSYSVYMLNIQHAHYIICVCLTCVAPDSASPGPASCPAGGWAPVWAASLTSGAPTPAGSASSDQSGSNSACGFPAPHASSGFLPAPTHWGTKALWVVGLIVGYIGQLKLENKGSGLQVMIILIMVYSPV